MKIFLEKYFYNKILRDYYRIIESYSMPFPNTKSH